jgi:uridine phosphorylase
MKSLISAQHTLAAARSSGLTDEALRLPGVAVLTFSKAVLDALGERCCLQDHAWIGARHHPYAAPEMVKRGRFRGINFTVVVPPMGASPLACVIEDLVACGSEMVFLVCGAWSLGPPVEVGDLIIPSFSVGQDGTSIHYGNRTGEVRAVPEVVRALCGACESLAVRHHVGGNASCEAMYRISREMVDARRGRGCLCMENGEASTLFASLQTLGIRGGALFQPYIDLDLGWDPAVVQGERYQKACIIQADVVLEACLRLHRAGLADKTTGIDAGPAPDDAACKPPSDHARKAII